MTWTGFAWLLNAFVAADTPAVFTLAVLVANLYLAAFVHLLLAYPEGRVKRRAHRRLVAAVYALAVARARAVPDVRLRRALRRTARSSVIQVTDEHDARHDRATR